MHNDCWITPCLAICNKSKIGLEESSKCQIRRLAKSISASSSMCHFTLLFLFFFFCQSFFHVFLFRVRAHFDRKQHELRFFTARCYSTLGFIDKGIITGCCRVTVFTHRDVNASVCAQPCDYHAKTNTAHESTAAGGTDTSGQWSQRFFIKTTQVYTSNINVIFFISINL